MDAERYIFRVQRYDPGQDERPHYQEYTLDVPEGMTVLEALLRIQAEQDGTLAFRYACRGAVCGSCAMRINGREDLACRTQVRQVAGRLQPRLHCDDPFEEGVHVHDQVLEHRQPPQRFQHDHAGFGGAGCLLPLRARVNR